MNTKTTTTNGTCNSDLLERTARLNEKGAHYFVGWLISAGMQRPEVMAELDRVLREFETDPGLQDCFAAEAKVSKTLRALEGNAPALDKEQQAVHCATGPRLVSKVPMPENPGKTDAPVAARAERRSLFPKKLLQVLFGKPSIAA